MKKRILLIQDQRDAAHLHLCGALNAITSMKRNIVGFVGIDPVKDIMVGMAAQLGPEKVRRWLERMADFGRAAA